MLAKTGLALAFVAEASKHGKPLAFMGEGAALIAEAHLPVPAAEAVEAPVEGLDEHRDHDRDIEAVAA